MHKALESIFFLVFITCFILFRKIVLDYKEDTLSHIFARDKSIKGKKMKIKEQEKVFWEQLIKTYLYPLNEDKEHQKKTQSELIELR